MPEPIDDNQLLLTLFRCDPPAWWPDGLRWCGGAEDASHHHWKRCHWPVSNDTAIAIACNAMTTWLAQNAERDGECSIELKLWDGSWTVKVRSWNPGVEPRAYSASTLLQALSRACEAEAFRAAMQAVVNAATPEQRQQDQQRQAVMERSVRDGQVEQ